jgi:diaminohydroxyphosphoribosylaminopyrimidine deaminase / 5-amino-6-(5-phosphoribosylamino)uracil reductase
MTDHDLMHRCNQIARWGRGFTRTNPMVGAVLVWNDQIIGEGYHTAYGEAHAEIQALRSVHMSDHPKIKESVLYVNLEPCCIHSKTPPCTDQIIEQGIPKVVIGIKDPNPKINGRGVDLLVRAGVEVIVGCAEAECKQLNKAFIKNMERQLPYVILKFAKSKDGFIGQKGFRIKISNDWSDYVVHKIRHQVDAILIGTETALVDNPKLTNRLYYGKNPIRIILDRTGRIPLAHEIFQDGLPTWIVSEADLSYPPIIRKVPWPTSFENLLHWMLGQGIGSLLVEGGAQILTHFVAANLWDELWCTTSDQILGQGIKAPDFEGILVIQHLIGQDCLEVFSPMEMMHTKNA